MLPLALTLVALGTALATRGLIGRRVGDEPRCRKCKYNLTGVESNECPECGRRRSRNSVARGLRHPRKLALAAGVGFLLTGAALLTPTARNRIQRTNFYEYLPTAIVIPAAARGSLNAYTVATDRLSNGKLSPVQVRELIESALSAQAAPTANATTQAWIELLAMLEAQSRLTTDQRNRYFRQMVTPRVRIPARIRKSRDGVCTIPVWFDKRFRCESVYGYAWRADVSVLLDDGPVIATDASVSDGISGLLIYPRITRRTYNESQSSPDLDLPLILSDISPGPHRLTFRLDAGIFRTNASPIPQLWSGTESISASFDLLPPEAPNPVAVISDATTLEALHNALEFRATLLRFGLILELLLEARVRSPAPCDALLSIRLERIEGESKWASSNSPWELRVIEGADSGDHFQEHLAVWDSNLRPGDSITLYIRSEQVAPKSATGLKRLAGGLELQPVTVTLQPPPATPTGHPAGMTGS